MANRSKGSRNRWHRTLPSFGPSVEQVKTHVVRPGAEGGMDAIIIDKEAMLKDRYEAHDMFELLDKEMNLIKLAKKDLGRCLI